MFDFETPAPEPATPAIAVNGLIKRYGHFLAVDEVSFNVNEGDFFAFLGPNGAGKTTSIHSIVGLVNYQGGNIEIFGKDIRRDFREARRYIGLSPQEYNFDRYLTIEEILVFQAGYFGVPKGTAKPRARELLSQFELWDKRDQDYLKLSGGQKRRLSLARALMHAPRILILDEPTAGVDVELRLELWDFLRALNRQGITIFLTTHYLEEAENLCNRIGIINAGKLVALDSMDALLGRLDQETFEITLEGAVGELPPPLDEYEVTRELEGRRLLVRGAPVKELPRILRALEARGYPLADFRIRRKNLQDVFLKMTSKVEP
jgi:ABC-2 type transport system ATP-binding protein